jgi:hypothetical protein
MTQEERARAAAEAALKERGWTYVGFGFFIPEAEPTVDGYGPDRLQIRAYPSEGEGQPPRCEVTDMDSEMSLWVEGIPDAKRVPWLMRQHKDILIHTTLGPGEHVLDLKSGEVVPESRRFR